jgi:hypothetical protein
MIPGRRAGNPCDRRDTTLYLESYFQKQEGADGEKPSAPSCFGVGENSNLILSEHLQSFVPDDSQLPVDGVLPRQKR